MMEDNEKEGVKKKEGKAKHQQLKDI